MRHQSQYYTFGRWPSSCNADRCSMTVEAITHIMELDLPPTLKLAAVVFADNYGYETVTVGEAEQCIEDGLNCTPGQAHVAVFQMVTSGIVERITNAEKAADSEIRLKAPRRPGQVKRIRKRKAASKPNASPRSKGYVYLLRNEVDPTIFKIGRTRNPKSRRETFGILLPFEVEYVCLVQTHNMFELERELHIRFADQRVNGEWFALTAEDVEYIKSLGGAA